MAKADPDRDRRLAEALRQNLRRRKTQAREAGEMNCGEADSGEVGSLHRPPSPFGKE